MTELTQTGIDNPTTPTVISFRRFVEELGASKGEPAEEIIASNPELLRLVRKHTPNSFSIEYFRPKGPNFEQRAIATFVQDQDPYLFEDLPDLDGDLRPPAWKFSSLLLISSGGDELRIEHVLGIHSDIVEISGIKSKKDFKKTEAGSVDQDLQFVLSYDYSSGRLLRGTLGFRYQGVGESQDFTKPDPNRNSSQRDREMGRVLQLNTENVIFALRVPEGLDLKSTIEETFSKDKIGPSAAKDPKNDTGWLAKNWEADVLNIRLNQLGVPVPLTL